ncbi:MAG: glutamate-1-semialdehyde 2,1-aminomutase [Elusimicrobia bacterium]|nr:glutamate-1-semialdehyde 2,1-aminomutase [Elusimicrobiota bacterium]
MAGMRSRRLFARAQKILVGGVNSPVRAFKSVGGSPVFMRSGAGAVLTDEDGKRYLDFCLSWGPLILGHARREVLAAAERALRRGSTFGAATAAEVELAERIRAALPSMELVRLTSSGTEADMSAVRVARAFTGRDLIVKCAGCYHGHVDSLLVAAGSGATTLGVPDSAGVPRAWARTTITLPYNDPKAFEAAFSRWGKRIAAVIIEPVAANMGVVLPKSGFLESLRRVTTKHGSLLIFDEVITGFRLAYGGWQSVCKIKPDLTVLGKIVGGGLPLAAYGGRRDIMRLVAPLGPVYQAGTLSGNPVAVAAGLETLRLLKEENPYPALARRAGELTARIRQEAAAVGVPVTVNSVGSMFTVFFTDHPVTEYTSALQADAGSYGAFFRALLEEGAYFPPAQWEAAFLSSCHKPADLDAAARALGRALRRVPRPSGRRS